MRSTVASSGRQHHARRLTKVVRRWPIMVGGGRWWRVWRERVDSSGARWQQGHAVATGGGSGLTEIVADIGVSFGG